LTALVSTPERRLLLLVLLTRLIPAALIWGSDDVTNWQTWGRVVVEGGNPYHTQFFLNWPPLWLPFAAWAYLVSLTMHLPFNLVVKLIPISADVVIAFLLYGVDRRAGFAYAWNPVAIYVTAVHGQFDSIPALFATMTIVLGRSAAWLGVGGAFKTWPMFVLPAAVHRLRDAAVPVAIFAAALLLPVPFVGWTALTGFLHYRGMGGFWVPSTPAIFYAAMAAAALFVWIVKPPPARGALLLLLTFYVTAPGFGVQYLIWIVPIALVVDPRNGLAYSILAGVVLAWEALARPYTGHIGETVRAVQHAGYARAYAGPVDWRYTMAGRLVLWAFFCYWWVVTIARASREGRRGPSYTKPV